MIDTRLRPRSRFSGYANGNDLAFFARELAGAEYEWRPALAPDARTLEDIRAGRIDWAGYEERHRATLEARRRRRRDKAWTYESAHRPVVNGRAA